MEKEHHDYDYPSPRKFDGHKEKGRLNPNGKPLDEIGKPSHAR